MSNKIIALLVAVSLSTWIYTKIGRRLANDPKPVIFVTAFIGIAIFLIIWVTLNAFVHV